MTLYEYPIDIEEDVCESGGACYLVTAPDLPGFVTNGDNRAEALENARDALVTWVDMRLEDRLPLPPASPADGRDVVRLSIAATLKLAIHQAMRADRVTQVELARRIGRDQKAVYRILDFNHASSPDMLDEALHALGRRPVITVEPVAGDDPVGAKNAGRAIDRALDALARQPEVAE